MNRAVVLTMPPSAMQLAKETCFRVVFQSVGSVVRRLSPLIFWKRSIPLSSNFFDLSSSFFIFDFLGCCFSSVMLQSELL